MTATPIEPTQADAQIVADAKAYFESGDWTWLGSKRHCQNLLDIVSRTTPAPSQHSELADKAIQAMSELANVRMEISLERWGVLATTILAALRKPPSDAMRNAVIEECAKVADQWNDLSPYNSRAAAIRALTQGKPDHD
jgi:hypothetical protein